jgi:hypothetical protein
MMEQGAFSGNGETNFTVNQPDTIHLLHPCAYITWTRHKQFDLMAAVPHEQLSMFPAQLECTANVKRTDRINKEALCGQWLLTKKRQGNIPNS